MHSMKHLTTGNTVGLDILLAVFLSIALSGQYGVNKRAYYPIFRQMQ